MCSYADNCSAHVCLRIQRHTTLRWLLLGDMYVETSYLISCVDVICCYSKVDVFSCYLELYTNDCCGQNRNFQYLGYVVTGQCQYQIDFRFKQNMHVSEVGLSQHSKLC